MVVDGSDQAFEVVNYIGKVFDLWRTEAVLHNVMDIVPDTFWDWEKEPLVPQHLAYMKTWEASREAQIREFMQRAGQVLTDAGLPEDSLVVNVERRKEGIARDILAEAERGYDSIALGRKGMGTVEDATLGNVAGKILGKLTDVSICLVGGKPTLGKILIGIDNSAGAARAVEFVADNLGSRNCSVTLAHVYRIPPVGFLPKADADKLLAEAESVMKPVFDNAVRTLTQAGIGSDRIFTRSIRGAVSRAGALIEEARQDGYGTIVIGRRGVSEVEDFYMGRIGSKLTQTARDMALWIIR